MAPPSSSAAARRAAFPDANRGSTVPDRRAAPRRPPLRILSPATRPKRRSGNRMLVLSAFFVIGSLMAVVVADDVIAQDQVGLASAQRQVATLTNTHRELQIEVSKQQAPQQVVKTAEGQLGMVPPGQITDLPEVSLSTPLPVPQTAPIPVPAAPPGPSATSSSNTTPH